MEDEEDGPQHPVEGDDAGAVVDAALAPRGALQALERGVDLVNALLVLQRKKERIIKDSKYIVTKSLLNSRKSAQVILAR